MIYKYLKLGIDSRSILNYICIMNKMQIITNQFPAFACNNCVCDKKKKKCCKKYKTAGKHCGSCPKK